MFFKNAYVFAFTRPFTTTDEELHAAMHDHSFTPLGSTELRHFGWTNSLGKGSNLTTESNGNILICARSEEKILPAPVVKDAVDAAIESAIDNDLGREPTKKEREQIKEDVIFELLPRAFNRITDTHAYINAEQNTIVVNASSRGKAEDLLALLRKTLGTLPVTNITPDKQPDEVMTGWLTGDHYDGVNSSTHIIGDFDLGLKVELHSVGDDSPIIKVNNMPLDCEEVKIHLDADMYVTKIALDYDETMSFMLHDDLSIKRIKFFDVIQEQNDDIDSDDAQAKLTGDFTLMAGVLNRMIHDLFAEFSVDARDYQEAE
tara:strand:+ start:1369 stop:2319 length:951 start_codon:yes stop_codon:yes gene_type:complete